MFLFSIRFCLTFHLCPFSGGSLLVLDRPSFISSPFLLHLPSTISPPLLLHTLLSNLHPSFIQTSSLLLLLLLFVFVFLPTLPILRCESAVSSAAWSTVRHWKQRLITGVNCVRNNLGSHRVWCFSRTPCKRKQQLLQEQTSKKRWRESSLTARLCYTLFLSVVAEQNTQAKCDITNHYNLQFTLFNFLILQCCSLQSASSKIISSALVELFVV